MSLTSAITTAITKTLTSKLSEAFAEEFELDEDAVAEFLKGWLAKELKSTAKGKRAGPKGKDGKGKKTGYMLFCAQERPKLQEKGLSFTEISSANSKRWKKVSEKEKAKWAEKATKQNEKNGLAAAATTKATKKDSNQPKAQKDKDSGQWIIEGTNLVVQSPRNKTVLGKLNKRGKVVALDKADKQKCKKMGLEIKGEEKKKSKKQEESSDDDDSGEASGSDDDSDSDSGSGDDSDDDSDSD